LRSLSLELPRFDSGNDFEGLRRFLWGLKGLQKLNSLCLAFKGINLRNKEVELVTLNLRDCSRYLEDLELRFEHAEKLGNEVLEYIGVGLQSLLSLKTLSVLIGKGKVFQKEEVFGLLNRLGILKRLESLAFFLEFPVSRSEMEATMMQMRSYQNLKRLTPSISRSEVRFE